MCNKNCKQLFHYTNLTLQKTFPFVVVLTAGATNSLRALSQFESEHTNPAIICLSAGISALVTMVT